MQAINRTDIRDEYAEHDAHTVGDRGAVPVKSRHRLKPPPLQP